MTYRDAARLHNGDEFTVKKTGTVYTVCEVEIQKGRREVFVTAAEQYQTFHHTEIKWRVPI